MSYIKIDIGGKERGFKFNQLAMQEFSLNYGRHNKLFESAPELFFVYNIFHAGLSGNCIVKNEEPDFTFYDVINWVDELYETRKDEDRANVVKAFSSTRLWEETMKAVTDAIEKPDEEKKS